MPTSSFKIAGLAPLLALSACIGGGHGGLSSEFAASYAPPPQPVPYSNGAIFQASPGYAPLTRGARAAHVGDILTTALVERTVPSKSSRPSPDTTAKAKWRGRQGQKE